jgi:lipoteichoic acid synthase
MIIPTIETMWNQDKMCMRYGFGSLYSSDDYNDGHDSNLNDEQLFRLAMQKDKLSKQPFFSVILTMSMHQPYTNQIDSTFHIKNDSIRDDLACYLNVCHYTDRQIKKYFDYLKQTGLYDNSLIVIAADHPVHNTDFGGVCKNLPLYVINSPISPQNMWHGDCNQLDVYTTILDLLGCDSEWYGLGRSLASTNYENEITANLWNVSEWIIMGDYFSK